ncbi:MAG: bifunctional phosphopantothenoylcysteine decarboxylase/phosphopantothenate--cysteine ligase CoaBC [Terriglobia bacterium]
MSEAKTVVLGVTGSIAAYKAVEIVRLLQREGVEVRVVMTESATRFVAPLTFEVLSENEVYRAMFDSASSKMPHITLSHEADLVVVAPATASTLAKAAAGSCDDILAATILSSRKPVIFAPAMHSEMYENQATQDNLMMLRRRGHLIVEPETGVLADGSSGVGRLADVGSIVRVVKGELERGQDLKGKKVIVTGGGTREPIDPVRFIGNRSSGKTGVALAEEVRLRGGQPVLITAAKRPVSSDIECLTVESAADMEDALLSRIDSAHAVVMSAAVSDFRPAEVQNRKIKKKERISVELVKNPDILGKVSKLVRNGANAGGIRPVLVGFAAESHDVLLNATEKLSRKGIDLIVANNVSSSESGFDSDELEFALVQEGEDPINFSLRSKREAARIIVSKMVSLMKG